MFEARGVYPVSVMLAAVAIGGGRCCGSVHCDASAKNGTRSDVAPLAVTVSSNEMSHEVVD